MGKTKKILYKQEMADTQKRRRGGARKYTFRGLELDELLKLPTDSLYDLFRSKIRRKLNRSNGFKGKYQKLLTKLRNSKKNLQLGEKPPMIKTHLRNCIVTPEMIGSIVGVYTGKEYKPTEIKFDMVGTYMGEYAMTYNPTLHNRPTQKKGAKK